MSPVSFANEEFMSKVTQRIIQPTIKGLITDGIDYRGFIFFGLINVEGEPFVIEYNCRMGDPETEAVMPRIESDLVYLLMQSANGHFTDACIEFSPMASTTVIAVSKGYPGSYEKGKTITLPSHLPHDVEIFQAGTRLKGDEIVTSGGRVLAVSAQAPDVAEALKKCYNELENISFDGMTYRRDIGKDLMASE